MVQSKLCFIYDERFLLHKSPYYHAENPNRLAMAFHYIHKSGFFDDVKIYKPLEASGAHIRLVHTKEHYNFIKNSINTGRTLIDPDTYIIKDSWTASKLAAGSVITAVNLVQNHQHDYAFCLVRPPGHHAESNKSMGFCLFNNVAIGAAYAINKFNLERIAIIDWDVHHGNGTQEIFYDSDKVMVFNIFQNPLYPGTGSTNEIGKGKGEGYNFNFPVPAGTKGSEFFRILGKQIIPKLKEYKPQLIFISAGFDAHKDDPLAQVELNEKDFGTLTKMLVDFAEDDDIPIISVLEGGYNLKALGKSIVAHLKEFIT
ncbi:MAG TPA: histone deacetylase family protein [Ignavibacteriaceae bacterium]|nr:histone deacetylase family protein [Ignavibacteriaceae bacterium]